MTDIACPRRVATGLDRAIGAGSRDPALTDGTRLPAITYVAALAFWLLWSLHSQSRRDIAGNSSSIEA